MARPEVGQFYADGDQVVEVRAISPSHVVTDAERVFRREEFERRFEPTHIPAPLPAVLHG